MDPLPIAFVVGMMIFMGCGIVYIERWAAKSRSNLEAAGRSRERIFIRIGQKARMEDYAADWQRLWALAEDVTLGEHYDALQHGIDPMKLYSPEIIALMQPAVPPTPNLRVVN